MSSAGHRVDYDQIAHLYDEPGRDYHADAELLRFLKQKTGGPPSALRVLDLGCGSGKQLAADHARLPRLRLVGLDRFHGMLQQARRRTPALAWVQGDGVSLPFRPPHSTTPPTNSRITTRPTRAAFSPRCSVC